MAYIKYGLLAAVLLIVTVLVLSTSAKESIQAWRPTVVPEKTVAVVLYSPKGGETFRIGETITSNFHVSTKDQSVIGNSLVDEAGEARNIGNPKGPWTIAFYADGSTVFPGRYKMRFTVG